MANEKRLIDANALLEDTRLIEQVIDNRPYGTKTIYETVVTADDIEAAPTVDAVEVVHGRWETIEGREYLGCLCSNCQKWSDAKTNYCPNCGAKMDGDGNGT